MIISPALVWLVSTHVESLKAEQTVPGMKPKQDIYTI